MMEELKVLVGSMQKFSTEDGPGIRTTVFLKGCPLDCRWCHNPEMIDPKQQMIISPSKCIGCKACEEACPNHGVNVGEDGPSIEWEKCESCSTCAKVCYTKALLPVAEWMTVEDVMKTVRQDKSFYDNTGGGITISGGEMLMHVDFVEALINACREEDINVCLDTSGFAQPAVVERLAKAENVTVILYDMKHIDDEKHKEYTGVSNTLILDNLKMLAADPQTAGKLWMRMPLVAGLNDDAETIEKTKDFYRAHKLRKVSLIPYHEMGNAKARHIGKSEKQFEPTSGERVQEIKEAFESIGMEVEIIGGEK